MKKLIIFYCVSAFLLLGLHLFKDQINHDQKPPGIIAIWLMEKIDRNVKKKSISNAYIKLVTGLSVPVNQEISSSISKTYLWLLFSNNGFHFYLFINFLTIFIFKKHRKKMINKLTPIIAILTNSYPILKIYLRFLLKKVFNHLNLRISKEWLFYLTMIFSAILSLFFHSTTSAVFCFIFLGTYQLTDDLTKLQQMFFHMISILFICIYQQVQFSLIGFLFSLMTIAIFKKFYSVFLSILVGLIIAIHPKILIQIITLFINLIKWASLGTSLDGTQNTLLLLFILIICYWKKKMRYLAFFFLFHSEPVLTPVVIYSK